MSDRDQIYIPARTLHKIHVFTRVDDDAEESNNLKCIHIFPEIVIATDGSVLAAYDLLDILSASGNHDVYDLLIGHALPKGVWEDMIKYPWLIYIDPKTGDKVIEISRKDNSMDYIISDLANDNVLKAYDKIMLSQEFKEPGTLYADGDFLKNLATVFGKKMAIKHRCLVKKDSLQFVTQVVKEFFPWLSVYKVWHEQDLADYPFGQRY